MVDHTCYEGVLQIDCETKRFGQMTPFQLERYIPYIKLDRWIMSDTTRDDRMAEQVLIYKKQSMWEAILGLISMLVHLVGQYIFPVLEEMWMLSIFGVLFMVSAAYRLVRVRNELQAIKEAREALEEEEKEMKAYLEDKPPVFHKTEE